MANWNLPTITSGYIEFVDEMNSKFVDAGTLHFGAPVNLPEHAFRFNRSVNIFEEWDLATWNPKVIGVAGGGTGANTASGARTTLGIGSMGTQNSNAVNITGGAISGVALNANDLATGIVALARGGTGSSLALGPIGSTFISNGTSVVFDTGINISQLNASSLVAGTVPQARLPTNIAYIDTANQTFVGFNTFKNPAGGGAGGYGGFTVWGLASYGYINYTSDAGLLDQHWTRIININGDLTIQKVNDAYTIAISLATFRNNGFVEMYGGAVTNLNANNITDGTVNPARLGAGAAHAGVFLRGDSVWATPSLAPVDPIPSGMIGMFTTNCPAGWTRVAGLDGRFPLGATSWGSQGGSNQHKHHVSRQTGNAGAHGHSLSGSASGRVSGRTGFTGVNSIGVQFASNSAGASSTHDHGVDIDVNLPLNGNAQDIGDHSHSLNFDTDDADAFPPYTTVVYCVKN